LERFQSKNVKLKYINEPPHQLRMAIDEEALKELAQSMQQHGLLQPILLHLDEEGKLTIIAGHRRYLAAQMLGWEEIPARVLSGSTPTQNKILSAIENIQRQDLNPIEEADIVGDLYYENKLSTKEIAELLNRSINWVQSRLEVRQYPMEVLQALHEGQVRLGVARIIAAIQDEGFRKWCLTQAIEGGATEAMVRQWIKDAYIEMTPEQRQKLMEKHKEISREAVERLRFACAVCGTEDLLENAMVARVCKACYLAMEAQKYRASKEGGEDKEIWEQ